MRGWCATGSCRSRGFVIALAVLTRRAVAGALAVAAVALLAGCGATRRGVPAGAQRSAPRAGSSQPPASTPDISPRTPATRPAAPAPAVTRPRTPTARPTPPAVQLPRGGRTILPRYRVVGYYGGPDGPTLGVLGAADPDTIAAQIEQTATSYAGYGRPVQPAMELITTVASPCTPATPLCTRPIADAAIQRYLDAAHRHHMLLILDFQPGRGQFLPQVQAVARFLLDPSVSVALDPEWKLQPGQYPMQVIGAATAASINPVAGYLSALVRRARLPDKLLVLHQFRLSMLPDRTNITAAAPGLEQVIQDDGFGTQPAKLATWAALAIPDPPFHAGFKLFFRQDTALMTPAQVMALHPQPELITYE